MGIIPANTQLQTSLQVTTETDNMPSHVQLLINTTNSTVIKVLPTVLLPRYYTLLSDAQINTTNSAGYCSCYQGAIFYLHSQFHDNRAVPVQINSVALRRS